MDNPQIFTEAVAPEEDEKTASRGSRGRKAKAANPPSVRIVMNLFYEPPGELKVLLSRNKDLYFPILGGAARKDVRFSAWMLRNAQRDDEGENISLHNAMLNEMTSIYWAWKHLDRLGNPDYVGFNHYRRFFAREELENLVDVDIVCARRMKFKTSVQTNYGTCHVRSHAERMLDVLAEMKSPMLDDAVGAFKGVFLFPCNLFVMKTVLFREYCSDLFPVLFRLEKEINLRGLTAYQQRAICFLGERLTSAWITKKMYEGCRIRQVPFVFKKEWQPDGTPNGRNPKGTPRQSQNGQP